MSKSQNSKNEQQKDLCITSEHLTEQWEKGELPDGMYYVELSDGNVIIMGNGKFAGWYNVKEVLAKVPSYSEYLTLQSENTKLKELLKECRDVAEFTKTIVNKHKWLDGMIAKINQALGEDK